MTITVLAIKGNKVRLGVLAPAGVLVHREEVWRRVCERPAAAVPRQPLAGGAYVHASFDR